MKLAWAILLHLMGIGCIAADIAIIATLGRYDLAWTGWLAVGFYWMLALGLAMGWQRLIGRPLSVIVLGFYVMATLMLLGLGFSPNMGQPTLLLAFAPLATALLGRIILDIIASRKSKPAAKPSAPTKATTHDTLFGP
ncbi:MAG: hypothetical protein Q8R82_17745 [Hyphomonadaceae bacterium]|nr:hypothetical protein [Hyphomonadaceae bacterium]